jgi:hypothetical protein
MYGCSIEKRLKATLERAFPNCIWWDECSIDTTSFGEWVKRTWNGMGENISVIIPVRNGGASCMP